MRRSLALAMAAATILAVPAGAMESGRPAPPHLDPAQLQRGADPRVAHLVGDTIVDGQRRVAATRRGDHVRLWSVRRGYVVEDVLPRREVLRLVYVGRAGEKRVIARRPWPTGAAVSPDGDRLAWGKALGPLGPPTVVKVADPATGRVVASRRFHFATVFAVTGSRVLLTLRGRDTPETTWWWNYRRDTLSQLAEQPARRADIRHDRLVLGTGGEDSFCNRVASLSDPQRTLWRSCRLAPHGWSPDGDRTLATHTYFDETGTDRWLTLRDRTGERLGRVTGRLDWTAAWEDDRHYLTLAQGDDGLAAVIRCTVRGRCERASQLWDVSWQSYPPFYKAPPVVLPEN